MALGLHTSWVKFLKLYHYIFEVCYTLYANADVQIVYGSKNPWQNKYEGELCVDIIMWDSVNLFHLKNAATKTLMGYAVNILTRI